MSEVAAIGSLAQVGGFALAGVRVLAADTAKQATDAWDGLSDAVAVVILTQPAADALGVHRYAARAPLTVVLPL